jgi:hypothetical protein
MIKQAVVAQAAKVALGGGSDRDKMAAARVLLAASRADAQIQLAFELSAAGMQPALINNNTLNVQVNQQLAAVPDDKLDLLEKKVDDAIAAATRAQSPGVNGVAKRDKGGEGTAPPRGFVS